MSTIPATATANFIPEFERVAAQLPGNTHVMQRRRAALASFAARGFPGVREEAWKYTNVAPIARGSFFVAGDEHAVDGSISALRGLEWEGIECVFVNGSYRPEFSRSGTAMTGVSLRPLAQVLAEDASTVDSLRGFNGAEMPALIALNAAFAGDGACIEIADHAEVDAPIRLLFVMTAGTAPVACFPRVLIRAGRGAKARVVESYHGAGGAEGYTNVVTEIVAGEDARIEHYRIQDEATKTLHTGSLFVDQERGSEVISHSLSFGALLARQDIHVRLNANDAAVTLNGLYMADGRQHVDHHTLIDHNQPQTRSEEYYKGILAGHSRGVFNGKVIVHPRAFKTDAQQSNKNLLLSKDAEVDTKPELEIYADDVKCAHGATVGQLDADALFYLRARGLDADAARGLLTYAFAGDVISRITIARLRRELTARIAGRMPDAARLLEDL